MKQIKNFVLKV